MRVCCISDLHGYLPDVPNCDVYGVYRIGEATTFVNASHCDEQYRSANKPIIVEV